MLKSPSQWSHFSTWLKQLPPRFLEIAIFLIPIGSFITMAVQLFFWAKELSSFSILLLKCFWRLEVTREQPTGTSAGCGSPPFTQLLGEEQSKQRRAELRRGPQSCLWSRLWEAALPVPSMGAADLRSLPHTQTLPPPPMYPSWWAMKMLQVSRGVSPDPSLILTSPTAKWRQPGPGSVIYTLAVIRKTPVRNPVRRSSNKGSTSPSWLLKFVLLEGFRCSFLFLVCWFAFTFFLRQKKHIWLKITHFPSLGLKARTTALNFVVMWCLNQQKLRESSSTGWSRAAKDQGPCHIAYQSKTLFRCSESRHLPQAWWIAWFTCSIMIFTSYFFLIHSPYCSKK